MTHDFKMPNDEELKARLTAEEYHVLREKGTEMPGSGDYLHTDASGTFMCKVCGNPLFASGTKFDSGTGWPSFDDAIPGAVTLEKDTSHRTEVTCARCGSHLGHVFDDGPTTTGKRYCINSVCLALEEH